MERASHRPEDDPERNALYMQIQGVLMGHDTRRVLCVLADALAAAIGVAADSLEEAEAVLDESVPEIKAVMRRNWDGLREARAKHGAGSVGRA